MTTLSFDVQSNDLTATLQSNKIVKLEFGTQADAEQFMILLKQSAEMGANLTMKLRRGTSSKGSDAR